MQDVTEAGSGPSGVGVEGQSGQKAGGRGGADPTAVEQCDPGENVKNAGGSDCRDANGDPLEVKHDASVVVERVLPDAVAHVIGIPLPNNG